MVRAAWLAVAAAAIAACAQAGAGEQTSAAVVIEAYLDAVAADDPRAAYELLSEREREMTSYGEFERAWRESPAERQRAARALRERAEDVEERAVVTLGDGEPVHLSRRGADWRLDAPPTNRRLAPTPADAVARFADAIAERSVSDVLRILTDERRDTLAGRIESLDAGLNRHRDAPLERLSEDRAALEWHDDGARYRIILRRQGDEWRVDELHIMGLSEAD